MLGLPYTFTFEWPAWMTKAEKRSNDLGLASTSDAVSTKESSSSSSSSLSTLSSLASLSSLSPSLASSIPAALGAPFTGAAESVVFNIALTGSVVTDTVVSDFCPSAFDCSRCCCCCCCCCWWWLRPTKRAETSRKEYENIDFYIS